MDDQRITVIAMMILVSTAGRLISNNHRYLVIADCRVIASKQVGETTQWLQDTSAIACMEHATLGPREYK